MGVLIETTGLPIETSQVTFKRGQIDSDQYTYL